MPNTWDVHCPDCGLLHTLKRSDLGVKLNCAGCGAPFKFDAPLRAEKSERKAEKQRVKEARRAARAADREADRLKRIEEQKAAEEEQQRRLEEMHREEMESAKAVVQGVNGTAVGCVRCGSTDIAQETKVSSTGNAMIIAGLVAALFTFGLALILCVLGAFMKETESICNNCKYQWRAT